MESSTGLSAGQDVQSSPELAPPAVTPEPQVQDATAVEQERSFTQSEVNEIGGKGRQQMRDQQRREVAEMERVQQEQALQRQQMQSKEHIAPTRSEPASAEDAIRQIVANELNTQRQTWEQQQQQQLEAQQAQAIVDKFNSKLLVGKDTYQDFDQVTGDIELSRFPNTVHLLADHVDNSADVLYELGKDRLKMGQIEALAYISPNDAIVQMQRLANSIKENKNAANVKLPAEPLSQLKHSNTSTGTNGVMSMKDLRAKYARSDWL